MNGQLYLKEVVRQFSGIKEKVELALAQIDDGALFRALDEDSNSVALLIKHVSGNLRSGWRDFLVSDGEKPDRERDTEFVLTSDDSRAQLVALWDEGFAHLFTALAALTSEDLERTVHIRGEPHTVMQAIQRQLSTPT